MNKKILIIFLCVLIVGLIACSIQSQERNKNEEKVRKLAENMGADSKDVEKNICIMVMPIMTQQDSTNVKL